MKYLWILENVYGKLFGWRILAPVHHLFINLSLHALGYGTLYRPSWTGEERFIRNQLAKRSPTVIFDVGANVGEYTALLLRETNAKIVCFEPNPSCVTSLQQRFLPESRVTIVPVAVSNTVGEAFLHVSSIHDEKASLAAHASATTSVAVLTTTIAEYCKQQSITAIDFLKIDTEGFEAEVLDGLGTLRPTIIQFEFNIDHLRRNCTLRSLAAKLPGYRLYRLLPNGVLEVNPEKYLNNIFMFSNYVAIAREEN